MADIDTLELQIESNADKAEKALDGLVTSLKKVKTAMGGFKTTEFSQVTNDAFKMAKAFGDAFAPLQKLTKETSKLKTVKLGIDTDDIEKGIGKLRKEFRNVGADFTFSGNADELEKAISDTAAQLDKLFAREDKLRNVGANINTSGFRGLEYDISLLTNKLDILREKREELQEAFAKNLENLPIQRMEYDTGGEREEKPRISNISPESLTYNPEAMKAVFGELAGNIENWNDAVSKLGGNASRVLNDMQLDFQNVGGRTSGLTEKVAEAGEKIKGSLKGAGLSAEQFETYLENLQIPEIRETNLKKLQSELERAEAKLDELQVKSDNWAAKGINPDSTQFRNLQEQIVSLSMKSDALRAKIQSIGESTPKLTGWEKLRSTLFSMPQSLDKLKISTNGVFGIVEKLKKGFLNFAKSIGKIIPGIGKMNKAISGLKKSSSGGFNIGKMFQMSALYSAISAVIGAVKNAVAEGSQNLAQYSSGYNQSISSMMSALTKLKNAFVVAFTPVINFVAPTITYFINLLSTAMNKVGQFFSALTGKTFTPQAVSVTQDYAAGLQDASKGMDNTTNSAKKLKKALSVLSFDQLNQLTAHDDENGTGGASGAGGGELSPADMFTTTSISQEIQDFADKVKTALGQIFKPFQEAWNKEGKNTIEAAKGAFESLRSLAGSVGKSLLEVWTNGTGTKTLTTMFQIAQNLFNIVGNLAGQFEKAWNKAGLGTSIIQNIFNLVNSVLGTIKNITEATADWARTLDFTPLLSSINSLLQALRPLTENIGTGLEWFWSNVLLPIGSWTLQDAVPTFLDMLSSGIGAVNSVVEALQPLGGWLWNNFLQPLGQWTGEAVISAMETVNGLLRGFGDWVSDHQGIVQNMAIIVGSFFAAFELHSIISGAVTAVSGFIEMISGAGGLLGALSSVVSALGGPVTLGIGAAIAAGVLLYKNWDKVKEAAGKLGEWISEKWEAIKAKTSEVWGNIKEFISTTWNDLTSWAEERFSAIQTTVGDVWDGMKDKASTIWDGIKEKITGIASGIKDTVSDTFEKLRTSVSGVFDGVVSTFKTPLNAVIGAFNGIITVMNGVISKINSISFKITVPDWIPKIGGSWWGFNGFNIPSVGSIPYLASGGVITAPTLAVMGEAFKQEAVLPLENKRTMSMIADSILSNADGELWLTKDEMRQAVTEGVVMAFMNNQFGNNNIQPLDITVRLENDEAIARAAIRGQQKIDYRMNPTPKFSY